jgi:hypothetical protein
MPNRFPSLRSDRSASIILKKSDRNTLDPAVGTQLVFSLRTENRELRTDFNRRGTRIAIIRTRHHLKQNLQVSHRASHGPDDSNQSKRPARLRIVSSRRNASRSRLQSANPTKMCRDANRPPAIAPHAARRKPSRNRRRLSATRPASRSRHVPGIVGASI